MAPIDALQIIDALAESAEGEHAARAADAAIEQLVHDEDGYDVAFALGDPEELLKTEVPN